MLKFLLKKPIAVLLTFIALIIAGSFLTNKVPISLLPNIDVPQIVIRIDYPNTTATLLDENVIRPIRENLTSIDRLHAIESQTTSHTGIIQLDFEYGTRMDLAYIEVNEKLDRISSSLPKDMARPEVVRVNTSDIPIVRLHLIPKLNTNITELSSLAEKVIRKRIEQLNGVSIIDISGFQRNVISVTPHNEILRSLGLDQSSIIYAIQNANHELGGLSVKDGQYSYFVHVKNNLTDINSIQNIPVLLPNKASIPIGRVVTITSDVEKPRGYHLYNDKLGLVFAIQKQPDSRMNELIIEIRALVEEFKSDYPGIQFEITQDQTFLLDAGINNLYQDIIYGGILTILLLFMFLGNWASPTLMSISIPVSLLITSIFFYLFNLSFNIISLSGLALGIGMLIDNSIVVIDNITRKRREGASLIDSSVEGTNEVVIPVVSQVLTTVVVYVPVILLSGISGSLMFDQSIALTISLCVSLLVAFVLAPMLYRLLLKTPPEKLKEDTIFYKKVSYLYHKMISHILNHKIPFFVLTICAMPVGFVIAFFLPIKSLPEIENTESLVKINWNQPVDVSENLNRVQKLISYVRPMCNVIESDVGLKQFNFQQSTNSITDVDIYFSCINNENRQKVNTSIAKWVDSLFPVALVDIKPAPNAFTQLFISRLPFIEARFKLLNSDNSQNIEVKVKNILQSLKGTGFMLGDGMLTEPSFEIILDHNKMALYEIDEDSIENMLKELFGVLTISDIRRFGDITSIRMNTDRNTLDQKLNSDILSLNGERYKLSTFVKLVAGFQPKFITSDIGGRFLSIKFEDSIKDVSKFKDRIHDLATKNNLSVEFTGQYFESKEQLSRLWLIFWLVLFLLYFILAIQYEDLLQPFIVMLTIPLGITGSMILLWVTGSSLNIIAATGFIVILGLIVDDPILKIEVLNKLEKKYLSQQLELDEQLLYKMIHEAGDICLKPLLLVSLTTTIALLPVLWFGGIGNDLQKPLALVVIGGLSIGTFFTLWFIPLAYWYTFKLKRKIKKLRKS